MSKDIRPPFTYESALAKVKFAEDAWNSCDPERVSMGYSMDSNWRIVLHSLQVVKRLRGF